MGGAPLRRTSAGEADERGCARFAGGGGGERASDAAESCAAKGSSSDASAPPSSLSLSPSTSARDSAAERRCRSAGCSSSCCCSFSSWSGHACDNCLALARTEGAWERAREFDAAGASGSCAAKGSSSSSSVRSHTQDNGTGHGASSTARPRERVHVGTADALRPVGGMRRAKLTLGAWRLLSMVRVLVVGAFTMLLLAMMLRHASRFLLRAWRAAAAAAACELRVLLLRGMSGRDGVGFPRLVQ